MKISCNNCNWTGYEEELIYGYTEKNVTHSVCPECKGESFTTINEEE